MTIKMRNEARRFITLLDALYEAKCQFYIRAAVEVEDLFFPEEVKDLKTNSEEVQEEEMYARTTLDTLNPYRPNVSSYDQDYAKEFNYSGKKIDFSNALAFTGEDEKFAYKRAISRIKEMVGSDHWRNTDRWVPIDITMRPWEDGKSDSQGDILQGYNNGQRVTWEKEILVRQVREALHNSLPREVSAQYNMPFGEFTRKIAPSISRPEHFWAAGERNGDKKNKIKDRLARMHQENKVKSA